MKLFLYQEILSLEFISLKTVDFSLYPFRGLNSMSKNRIWLALTQDPICMWGFGKGAKCWIIFCSTMKLERPRNFVTYLEFSKTFIDLKYLSSWISWLLNILALEYPDSSISMFLNIVVSGYRGFWISRFLIIAFPDYRGSWLSWFLIIVVSEYRGFWISWFLNISSLTQP